jgi:dTDP-4-dehydrorhamnose reductase
VILSRPIVIGANGQLGSEVMRALAAYRPTGLTHADIEIEDEASVETVFAGTKPTLVVNTAAFSNVDECERRPDRAFAVNALAVDRLAAAAARHGAAFATISTDFVFRGDSRRPYGESDRPEPRTLYGLSKLAGELCARRHSSRHFIFRTSGLYGLRTATQKGHTFVDVILRQACAGQTPRVVTDVIFSPSYAADVAIALRSVFEREAYGLFHVTNSGSCSWFQFAEEALRLARLSSAITPISYRDFGSPVPRPPYTALACEALRGLGIEMPSWQDGLRRYVQARLAGAA